MHGGLGDLKAEEERKRELTVNKNVERVEWKAWPLTPPPLLHPEPLGPSKKSLNPKLKKLSHDILSDLACTVLF